MNNDESHFTNRGFLLILVYLALAGVASYTTGLAFFFYALLPSCITYIYYKNDNKKVKVSIALLIALPFLVLPIHTKSSIFVLTIMGFFTYKLIDSNKDKQLDNLGKIILISLLTSAVFMAIIKYLAPEMSLLNQVNRIITDSNIKNQINSIIARNQNLSDLNISSLDQNQLKTIITSSMTLISFNLIALASVINFAISTRIMRKRTLGIAKIKRLHKIAFPRKINLSCMVLLLLSYMFASSLGEFGTGLILIFFGITVEIFSIQGLFLLSYALNKKKLNYKLHIIILIILWILLSITAFGSFVLVNAGFIDSVFDIRKVSRRPTMKSQ